MAACFDCLRRSWLVAALGPQLDHFRFDSVRLAQRLGAPDDALLRDVAGPDLAELRARYEAFDPSWIAAPALESAVCRHMPGYPPRLLAAESAPCVLYASSLDRLERLPGMGAVAIAGARDPSEWERARAALVARSLASAGIAIVAGIAPGVASAALDAALQAHAEPVAVMPCGPDMAYPARSATLITQIEGHGTILSELRPGTRKHAWAFSARHRIVTGLADALVVIEGSRESGARAVARVARSLGHPVLLVSALADESPVLADGARLVRSSHELLDAIANLGGDSPPSSEPAVATEAPAARPAPPPAPAVADPALAALLELVAAGANTVAALAERGLDTATARSGLAQLEIMGHVLRSPNGTYLAA
jgi:DNA processing protein